MKNKKPIFKKPKRTFISKANIGNLKAFRGINQIEFAPMINLIFGKNSSGKSTINQSLRLFRQSYGYDKLTPFNYESPPELRGKGGLDIDVGYSGLVNNGDLTSNISLGVETGIYDANKKEISKDKRSINYTYKFKRNFYTGKNLVRERTILTKLHFLNAGGEAKVDLPKHVFFEDKSPLGKSIRNAQRYHSGELFYSNQRTKIEPLYKSVYHPYFYKTSFKPENLKIDSLNQTFEDQKQLNSKDLEKFFNEFLKYLKSKKILTTKELRNKKNKKPKEEKFFGQDFVNHQSELEPINKEVNSFRKNSNGDLKKLINSFLKKPDAIFKSIDEEFIEYDAELKSKINQINDLTKDIILLINFFSTKNISKEKFINFFKNDICNKSKNIIFFNGYFITLPNIKDKNRNKYREQRGENYLINILNYLLSTSETHFRDVNIFTGYQDRSRGRRTSSSMSGINEVMNKFLVAPGLRQIPKRYFVKGLQTDYVGPSAENLGELLANPEINKATNKWLEKLEIPYKVDIQNSDNYYEIVFVPKNSKIKISSMHIGLGYPLILPFIVQCIIAKDKIILIEEPEVHLHPKIEADLADLIVESSLLRNNQFIIETHSEDFLLRVLKSIRQGKLKPQDVAVNYISPNDKNGSIINKITINKFGQYTTPWHDNLFAERRREFTS